MTTFDALCAPLRGAVLFIAILATGCSGRSSASDAQASAAASADAAAIAVSTGSPADAGSTPVDAGSSPAIAASTPADAGSVPAAAASAPPDAGSAPPDSASAPADTGSAAPIAAASAAPASGTCPLIATAQVETVMHLTVKSIDITDDASACTFHFKNGDSYADVHGDLDVEYHTSGGPDEVNALRTAAGGVKSIVGAIAGAVSAPPGAAGAAMPTAPPGVAKVGDDQAFMDAGMDTKFCASKGDAYVEVDGGFFAQGVTGWTALPQIASDVLASR